jgi:hypothetical protein
MASRRLLVVATVPVEETLLREQLRERTGGADAEVRVIAPAADVSPLQWLANDEDDARADAERVAGDAAGAIGGDANVVDAGVGDSDPVKAIEDALREWPADEVVVVTASGEDANWLERGAGAQADQRFGVPVTHLAV